MRFINPNLYLSMALCLILFISGRQLAMLPGDGKVRKNTFLMLSALAVPALLFPIGYLDFFGESPLYCTFRSINRIELLTSLVAPIFGYITYRRPRKIEYDQGFVRVIKKLRPFAFPFCIMFIVLCFIKPIIRPLDKNLGFADFADTWNYDVMMQSSASTCGPSALATVMYRIDGFRDTEESIARGAYTCRTGTENWYLARYAVSLGRGYKVRFSAYRDIRDFTEASAPSIVGVKLSGAGHYIAVLSANNGLIEVGDPLSGKLTLSVDDFDNRYEFTGFVMVIIPL